MIKQSVIAEFRRYVDQHCPSGDFLHAVLSNDLTEAVQRADDDNLAVLPEIVRYCCNEIPGLCWGSPELVRAWLAVRPKEGA
jgi:hypothetical protein